VWGHIIIYVLLVFVVFVALWGFGCVVWGFVCFLYCICGVFSLYKFWLGVYYFCYGMCGVMGLGVLCSICVLRFLCLLCRYLCIMYWMLWLFCYFIC